MSVIWVEGAGGAPGVGHDERGQPGGVRSDVVKDQVGQAIFGRPNKQLQNNFPPLTPKNNLYKFTPKNS